MGYKYDLIREYYIHLEVKYEIVYIYEVNFIHVINRSKQQDLLNLLGVMYAIVFSLEPHIFLLFNLLWQLKELKNNKDVFKTTLHICSGR